MSRPRRLAALLMLAVLAVSGCAAGPASSPGTGGRTEPSGLSGSLTVYAAASLAVVFDEIAEAFEAENPGVEVRPISYDGSTTLATQLIAGASADVFASADETSMADVVAAGLAHDPQVFASNTLVIAVPAGNPAGIRRLADLAADDATVVLCAPRVPCGTASRALLAAAGVSVVPASAEQNVTAVLTKVAAGEADAGLVYATDALGRPDVEAIVPEGAPDVVNRYPIAALTDAPDPEVAAAFVRFTQSDAARRLLTGAGFGPA